MGSVATTIDEQIKILEERGMTFDCEESKLKEILLDIGYYKLGFYWHHFQKDRNHNFFEGTKISDVIKLYYLDVNLKSVLVKAINRIEVNFKTKLIYFVSNKYKDNPFWFCASSLVGDYFIDEFPRVYTNKFINDNKPIKSHHKKYPKHTYAPAWKTLEFLSLGSIIVLYSCLKDSNLKKEIALCFGIKKPAIFENYLKTIVFIRNICAHNDLLYDCNTAKEIETTPMIIFNNNNRHSLDSSIKVILYFLGQVSINRKNEVEKEINSFFKEHQTNPVISKILTEKSNYQF
ncbi:Abi family protein [Epilithonimonas hominis]|uniref:Abi family protein n=1 Tax=Epilithonimonas hominis TaxID=420404 RepID=UPI0028A25CEC|nr:Abi family protein [Epilithonimonas hominis]